jgi:hypothetical protein
MPDGMRVAFHVIVPDGVRSVDCQPQSLVGFRKSVSTWQDNTPHDHSKRAFRDVHVEVLVTKIFQARSDEG